LAEKRATCKATLTMRWFYPTDKVTLDAKNFDNRRCPTARRYARADYNKNN
jgi:hypothetical protein